VLDENFWIEDSGYIHLLPNLPTQGSMAANMKAAKMKKGDDVPEKIADLQPDLNLFSLGMFTRPVKVDFGWFSTVPKHF
jgi:hypothetical protein